MSVQRLSVAEHQILCVDVPGPAIVRLSTNKLSNLVTVNLDTLTEKGKASQEKVQPKKAKTPKSISTSTDLKKTYPTQFDKTGHFNVKAKLRRR